MRLRILELPSQVRGDDVTTPWVFVVDEVDKFRLNNLEDFSKPFMEKQGCAGLLVFKDSVDLPAVDD